MNAVNKRKTVKIRITSVCMELAKAGVKKGQNYEGEQHENGTVFFLAHDSRRTGTIFQNTDCVAYPGINCEVI